MIETISQELVDKLRAELAAERALRKDQEVLIDHLKLTIAKLQHDRYGPRSERTERLLDQLSLQLEEIEANVSEDDLAAEQMTASSTSTIGAYQRKKPTRKAFPADLPRVRVVLPAPTTCACCGGSKLVKLGEDITETLEIIPRQWKVHQTVREKFSCRDCEKISQEPAPFHVIPRGFAGPSLLAMIVFEKYGQHMPLNRQSERYAHEGIDLCVSTMADLVGATAFALKPIHDLIEAHVFKAHRLHADDTTVPVLAKHKTRTGRIWVYCRDDEPFGGQDPPAAVYYYSPDRTADHPLEHLRNWTGTLQSDAYSGYNPLSHEARPNGPITHAFCWVHARRGFFKLADIETAAVKRSKGKTDVVLSPVCLEAVRRIDAIFAIEREINGKTIDERLAARREHVAPLVADLEAWMRSVREQMSKHVEAAKAIDYMLKRWEGFTRFLDDGRLCLSNNAAERALRHIACGRKSWMFCGSDRGGQRAAVMYSLIATCRMNDIDPEAWLGYTLAHIAELPKSRLHELLPWNWKKPAALQAMAA